MPRAARAKDLGIRICRFDPSPTDRITVVAGAGIATATTFKGDGARHRRVNGVTAVGFPLEVVRAALD